MIWRNQRGMTLVEVMVAAGLLGALAIAGVTLYKNQDKAQQTVQQNYDITAVAQEIRTILSDSASCKDSLVGMNPDTATGTITSLKKTKAGVPTTVFTVNTAIPGTKSVIKSYQLRKTGMNPPLAADETMLIITFVRSGTALATETPRSIKIKYTLASGTIDTCNSVGTANDLWKMSVIDPNDIYYTSGDVGIGTSSPNFLAVNSPVLTIANSGTSALVSPSIELGRTGALPANGEVFAIRGVTQSTPAQVVAITSNIATAQDSGTLSFFTKQTGQPIASRMMLDDLGNIGIGTSVPRSKLDVFNATGSEIRLSSTTPANYGELIFSSNNSGFLNYGASIQGTGDGVGLDVGSLEFKTGYGAVRSTKMKISSGGNVGIGTTSPGGKLHINNTTQTTGSLVYIKSTVNGSSGFQYDHAGDTTQAILVGDWTTGTSKTGLYLRSSTESVISRGSGAALTFKRGGGMGTEEMRIDPTGLVGIGTTSPRVRLDVYGEIAAMNRITVTSDTTSTSPTWSIDNPGDTFRIFRQPNISTAGIEYVNINNAGFVGINNNAPGARLDVNGNVRLSGLSPEIELNSGGPRLRVASGNTLSIHTGGGFGSAASEMVRIGTTGMTVYGGITATSYTYSSDKKLKHDINTYENGLGQVLKLRGVTFTWNKDDKNDVGFIAQEVEKVEPRLVETHSDGFKSVKYGNIVAMVVEAIKDLHKMVMNLVTHQNEQAKQISSLKKENAELKSRLDQQEARMKAQEAAIAELMGKNKKK